MDEADALLQKGEISEDEAKEYLDRLDYLLDNRDGLDVYDMKSFSSFELGSGLCASTLHQTRACFIIQLISPILVILNTIFQIINPDAVIGGEDWSNMCRAKDGWGSAWLNLTNVSDKLVGVVIVYYIYLYMDRYVITWRGKCITEVFRRGYAYGLMQDPFWAGLGVVTNGLSLALAGIASVPIVYYSFTSLDIVLNSLALFFIIEVDEYVVNKYDFIHNLAKVEAQMNDEQLPFELGDSVMIISDEESFQAAFEQFDESDQLNGWTEEKAESLGRLGTVTKLFRKKNAVEVMFPDRSTYRFPTEAIEPKEMPPILIAYPNFSAWIDYTDNALTLSKYIVLTSCFYVLVCR